jgi:hypothetical protein
MRIEEKEDQVEGRSVKTAGSEAMQTHPPPPDFRVCARRLCSRVTNAPLTFVRSQSLRSALPSTCAVRYQHLPLRHHPLRCRKSSSTAAIRHQGSRRRIYVLLVVVVVVVVAGVFSDANASRRWSNQAKPHILRSPPCSHTCQPPTIVLPAPTVPNGPLLLALAPLAYPPYSAHTTHTSFPSSSMQHTQ